LGFCVLGLFALNSTGITGSVMYMINHGLSTGALFVLIGMIYERYHTRSMKELGGLAARMPIWATFMVFFTMASVGLPGLNGFVSEFLCLLGAFQAGESWTGLPGATAGRLGFWYTLVAGIGMIVAAMYLLYMVGRVVWGPLVEPAGHAPSAHGAHAHGSHGHEAHGHAAHDQHGASHGTTLPTDLNAREIGILVPLAIACLGLGLYPKPLLDAIQRPVSRTIELVHRAPVSTPAEPARTQPAHAEVTP
jgi:NADH-quinone oxidoreductase subunit M